MFNYKAQYIKLFNQILNTINTLEKEADKLKKVQNETEAAIIADESNNENEEEYEV